MSEDWQKWFADFGGEALGTVLHLGAGMGQQVEAVRATQAARIVLVEPEPRAAAALTQKAKSDERIQVFPAAIAAQTGQAVLHRFNMAALSSLRRPTALTELFPGLSETGPVEVDTLSVSDLLAQLALSDDRPNVLLLDAPGEQADILAQLHKSGKLTLFRDIFLRAGRRALYQDAATAREMIETLESEGYRIRAKSEHDPDFPAFHLRIDPLILENNRLRSALQQSRSECEELDLAFKTAKADEAGRIAKIAKLEKALETAKGEAQVKIDEFKRTIAATKGADQAKIDELERALAATKGTDQAKIDELERTAAQKQNRQQQAVEEATARAEKARQDLSLSLRLQSLREADLAALESKYAALLAQKEEQDGLLRKLTVQLSRAAEHLKQIDLPATEAASAKVASQEKSVRKTQSKASGSSAKQRRKKA